MRKEEEKQSNFDSISIKSKHSVKSDAKSFKAPFDDKSSIKSFQSASIRTTTTTKERLEDIERQLQEEIVKRKAAEDAIKELKKNNRF